MFTALNAILSQVPTYVWAILAMLLVLGVMQSRDRFMNRQRLMILPLVWLGYGLWGVFNTFGFGASVILPWVLALVLSLATLRQIGWAHGSRFDAKTQLYFVPGSWAPLALMLSLFAAKFALGMSLGMRPELISNANFAASFSALFGCLSGALLARSRQILQSATPTQVQLQGAQGAQGA
ncbi:DUF6622 family protein [Paucibacter sp. Y2R2-4]|uniref:DUF6622 family protein n=1 Tax=Paucibacter sp. Y2R2-4 TaxID=2893553 RepID=UPI0021E4900C|nr:DUF6622 family protein [Paucibacter sp. Y2R2-4]MCV2351910.1 tat pathway signal sequence [Paucibacter sp. Y2R2-4]